VKEWLTVREAALLIGRDVSRIYRWINTWGLDHRKEGRVTLVRAEHLRQIEGVLHRNPNARPTHRA
jgi:transposase